MTTEIFIQMLSWLIFIGAGLGACLFVIYSLSGIAKKEHKVKMSLKCQRNYVGNLIVDLSKDSVENSINLTFNMDYAELVDIISKEHEITLSANVIE